MKKGIVNNDRFKVSKIVIIVNINIVFFIISPFLHSRQIAYRHIRQFSPK